MDRYAVETHPNKAIVTFHFTKEVPKIPSWLCFESKELSPNAKAMKDALLKIPGVVDVGTHNSKQSITVTRGGAYTLDDIEEPIIEVVRAQLNMESIVKVLPYA